MRVRSGAGSSPRDRLLDAAVWSQRDAAGDVDGVRRGPERSGSHSGPRWTPLTACHAAQNHRQSRVPKAIAARPVACVIVVVGPRQRGKSAGAYLEEEEVMDEPIVYIDRSTIRTGKVGALRRAIDDLVGFIEEREPQLIHYGFYLDELASRMTVIAWAGPPRTSGTNRRSHRSRPGEIPSERGCAGGRREPCRHSDAGLRLDHSSGPRPTARVASDGDAEPLGRRPLGRWPPSCTRQASTRDTNGRSGRPSRAETRSFDPRFVPAPRARPIGEASILC